MSTLKATYLQQASSASPNITLDASTNATVAGTLAMGSSFKRNAIINGNMSVAQRGTTYNPSGYYQYGSVDRWSSTSNASNTIAQSTDAPTGFKNSCSISATSAAYPGIAQRIESVNCTDLVGQTITISAYVKKTTGTGNIDVALYYANSADNFGGLTQIGAQTTLATSPTSTWLRYSIQFTNLPSGAANGIQISMFTPSGSTSDVCLITGVQLEVGSVATPYERQIYSEQLLQCQRYYAKSYLDGVTPGTSTNTGKNSWVSMGTVSTFMRYSQPFPVTMRAAPTTVAIYSTTGASGNVRLNNASDFAVTTEDAGALAFAFYGNRSWTAGDFVWWQWTASAEL